MLWQAFAHLNFSKVFTFTSDFGGKKRRNLIVMIENVDNLIFRGVRGLVDPVIEPFFKHDWF